MMCSTRKQKRRECQEGERECVSVVWVDALAKVSDSNIFGRILHISVLPTGTDIILIRS